MHASMSKSLTFDHSDQHNSDIGVSDQPASAASSERSSPSNDYKIITPMISENSNEVSDLHHNRKKSEGSRFRQKRFPPRIAKQRENLVKAVSVNNVLPWDISISKTSNTKDASPIPPSSVIHSPHSHFPVVSCNSPSSSIGNTIVRSCSSVIPTDDQVAASTSKSSSFDHSDQHDRGIGVNDQPASALSSRRLSPSNDSQIISPTSSVKNANSTEEPDLVWENDPSLSTVMEHPQAVQEGENLTACGSFSGSIETSDSVYNKADNSSQNRREAETTEMSFRENSLLQQSNSVLPKNVDDSATSVKSHIQIGAQHNSMPGPHCTEPLSPELMGGFEAMTGICAISGLTSSVQVAEISAVPSPPTVLFNPSQQAWENDPPLPSVMEYPQTVPQENESSTSYGSFSGSSETTASVYNNADNSSQNRKEAETTEMSFRENSPLQQNNSVLSKNIDHSETSVKSHIQMGAQHNSMADPHCTEPLSPQIMGGFESMTGICAISGLTSSAQVAEIPAIPSPQTVLFNSSQQVLENDPTLPTIMEHPQAVTGKDQRSTYGSFSGSSETSDSVYNNADSSSQNRKEAESTEISFRENSSLQQSNSVLPKNIDDNATSVKSHIQIGAQHNFMVGPHCTEPLSPQIMGGFEAMIGICAISGLTSSVQVAEISAVPSPPTVLFNPSQQLSGEKRRSSGNTGHSPKKSKIPSRSMNVSNSSTNVSVQSPISPSVDDFILKIQSVKKVLENDPPLPTVMEHPQAVAEEDPCSTSYVSFSGSSETTGSVYNNADNSSQNRIEAETTEMSFRKNSPPQQSDSVLSKNIDHSATSVKSNVQVAAQHNSMTGPHCTVPLSPQLVCGFEPKTGVFAVTSLASSAQVAEIPAVPSPPSVLFNSSQQGEENSEMKLEFTFESCLEQLSREKRRSSGNTGHSSKKSKSLAISTNVSKFSTNISVQSPISSSADDLILKIQSVKKVLENDPPLPTVMEHSQAVAEEDECSTSYVSFSGSSETTGSVYDNADNSSQNRIEAETTEMSFRKNSPLQQSDSVLSKNIDHSATSVKSNVQVAAQHNSMAGPHCTVPLSPQLMCGFEPKTDVCAITSLASSAQVVEIPAVPSPPSVLFNSSQQVWGNDRPLPIVMERPQAAPEEDESSTSYGSFSGISETTGSVDNNADNSSQNKEKAESTEMLFRENSPLQQSNSVLSKKYDPPLPTVMEHPQAVAEEDLCSTSYVSFSGSIETSDSVYNNADNSSQNRIEAETTEMSFRKNSPLQQTDSVLSKNIDHSVTSVKSHIQMAAQHNSMAGPHCTGPVSPPLLGGFETMTGICAITGLSSPIQVAGIPAVRSQPTVLFNSSQQVWKNDPLLTTVMEHPQVVPEEDEYLTSYGSFSDSSETIASVYNNAYNSSQNRKETETTEMSFREISPLQQSNSVLSKNIDHSATSVKSHIQMAAQHNSMANNCMAAPYCTGPLTPPLMGGFEAMTGICSISGFSSSEQLAGTSAIPCPPTVLFNCSQQPCKQNKSGRSRSGRYRLPSRFVKQRKNLVKAVSVNNVTDCDISGDPISKNSNTKDALLSSPSSFNDCELPITHSLHPHFPVVISNTPSTSIGNTIVSSCSSVIPTDDQVIASTSKASSFDHSVKHDSGIHVNDQTASALSSQRSSPSNDCQIIASTSSGKNANSNEVPDLDVTSSTCNALPSIDASLSNKFKDSTAETEEKARSLPITFHSKRKRRVKNPSSKVSKRQMKKSRHLETSSPSLSDYIFDYDKLPKDFNCTTCSFSCLSRQMFKTHSCSEKLKQMAACKIIVEKIPDNHNKSENGYKCPKCCFYSSNSPNHSCDERLRYMQNCFVKIEDNVESKFNIMYPIKMAQICNHLHQKLVSEAKQKILKNTKIYNSITEVMQHIVEPVLKINLTYDPKNSTPDVDLDFTLPYQNQKLLMQAAQKIFVENEVVIPSKSRNKET